MKKLLLSMRLPPGDFSHELTIHLWLQTFVRTVHTSKTVADSSYDFVSMRYLFVDYYLSTDCACRHVADCLRAILDANERALNFVYSHYSWISFSYLKMMRFFFITYLILRKIYCF